MSPALFGLVLLAVCVLLAYLFNHGYTRVAFLELALSEGVPGQPESTNHGFQAAAAEEALPADAIAIFASATCLTCVELIEALRDPDVDLVLPLHLHFSQSAPAIADFGTVHEDQVPLVQQLQIAMTPYAVILRSGQVVAHGTAPNTKRLRSLMVQGGVQGMQLPADAEVLAP